MRLRLLRERGGKRAAAFWAIRRLFGIDVYHLLSTEVRTTAQRPLASGTHVRAFSTAQDLSDCATALIGQIEPHTGMGLAATISRGGRVYALVRDGTSLSQLTIDFHSVYVDTPMHLRLDIDKWSAFLSFLYTPPIMRGHGFASALVAHVCASLAAQGYRDCICHVQASNVRSINTFEGTGWDTFGWLVATRRRARVLRMPRKGEQPVFQASPAAAGQPLTPG